MLSLSGQRSIVRRSLHFLLLKYAFHFVFDYFCFCCANLFPQITTQPPHKSLQIVIHVQGGADILLCEASWCLHGSWLVIAWYSTHVSPICSIYLCFSTYIVLLQLVTRSRKLGFLEQHLGRKLAGLVLKRGEYYFVP